jgi:hypothetical protein
MQKTHAHTGIHESRHSVRCAAVLSESAHKKPGAARSDITETNRIHLILFDMQNRTLGPYLAANSRLLISALWVLALPWLQPLVRFCPRPRAIHRPRASSCSSGTLHTALRPQPHAIVPSSPNKNHGKGSANPKNSRLPGSSRQNQNAHCICCLRIERGATPKKHPAQNISRSDPPRSPSEWVSVVPQRRRNIRTERVLYLSIYLSSIWSTHQTQFTKIDRGYETSAAARHAMNEWSIYLDGARPALHPLPNQKKTRGARATEPATPRSKPESRTRRNKRFVRSLAAPTRQ